MSKQGTLKSNTTHVVLNDDREPGKYVVWSEHKSEKGAVSRCTTLGRNGKQGHTVVVPVADLAKWTLA
jgi:hypothetical protein